MRLVIPDLLPGTDYAIQVRADDGSEQSEWSTRFEVTTAEDTTLPTAPANVTWVVTGDAFYGEWDSVGINVNNDFALITRYELELVGNGVTKIVTVPQQTGTRVNYTLNFETNRALFGNPAATVTLRVRSVDQKGLKSAWTAVKSATNPAPGPVTSLVATGLTDQVGLTWVAPSDNDVIGYNIYASTTAGFNPEPINKVGFSGSTFFNHQTSNYTTWHYVVRTVDKFGTESVMTRASATPLSPFVVDITAPPVPTISGTTISTVDATGETSIKVDWTYPDPPSDLSDFVIRYRPAGQTPVAAWETETIPATADELPLSATITKLRPYVDYEIQMRARDFYANESAWTATTTATKSNNVAPSTPATPTAAANTQQIQVVHSGNRSTGPAMEADVVEYEVYASTTSGFTPATANLLGKIPAGPAIVGTFSVPASAATGTTQTWYVKVIAVDSGGLKSPASGQATAAVGLISTANIGDAQITNAKITELSVTKLTAGSGLTTDFTIKSKLTLGDATTDGAIESFGYTAGGTTGFRLAKSGLVIKSGTIEAAALKIQNGPNIMHPAYADFEYKDFFYINPFWNVRGQGKLYTNGPATNGVENDAPALFGKQTLSINSFTGVSPWQVWLGESETNYNVDVEAGAKYIVSLYLYNRSGTGADLGVTLQVKGNNGNVFATQAVTVPNDSTWRRYQFVVTVPAGVNRILVGMNKTDSTKTTWLMVDGVQVERVEAGLETASPWKPPASTTISGAGIITGMIRSFQNVTVNGTEQPMWSINMNGAAQFGDASVRGKLIVGPAGGTDNGESFIQSGNYVQNQSGWKIKSDGVAEFANITSRAPNGTRTEIANAANPYESGQNWNVISMWSPNAAWTPAQIWVNHLPGTPNAGVMMLASPKLGGANPAQIQLWSSETTDGDTRMVLWAEKIESTATSYFFGTSSARNILSMDANNFIATANTFTFGDPNGTAVVIKMGYAGSNGSQTMSFRSPGNKRIDFDFGVVGENQITSLTETGAREKLNFQTQDILWSLSSAAGNLYFGAATQMSNRPLIANPASNCAVVFPADTEIRLTSLNGGAYIDGRAARWLTSSDMRFKSDVKEVTSTSKPMREKLRGLKAYDYGREPHAKMSAAEMRSAKKQGLVQEKKYRGMSAQEIQKVMPEVVVDDLDGETGLAVDIYGLLTNTIQALNELQDEVDDLRAQLASK